MSIGAKEADKFLDSSKPPKLNQEEIYTLNRLKTNTIETVVKNLMPKKSPGPDGHIAFHQTFSGLQPIILNYFLKEEEETERAFPSSSCKSVLLQYPNQAKTTQKEKLFC